MNTSKKLMLAGLSLACVTGVAACSKSDTPEMVGEKVEEASEKMAQTMDEASEKMGEMTDEAATTLSEAGEEAGEFIDDAAITAKVKSAIMAETDLKLLQVKVETVDGVVTLTGSADTAQNIDKAKELASMIEGVKGVENRLALESND